MTYKEIINLFRSINTTVNSAGTFIHGRKPEASFVSIAAAWPLVFVLPFRETTDYKRETINRSIVMFFLKQDDPNAITPEAREDLIQEAYVIKEAFIRRLIAVSDDPTSSYFGKCTISEVMATPEYSQMAGTVSGYSVSFNLSTKTDC